MKVSCSVATGFTLHLRDLQTSDESNPADSWLCADAAPLVQFGSSRCHVVDLPAGGAASLLRVPGGGVVQAAVGGPAVRGSGGLFVGPQAPPGATAEPGEFRTSRPGSALDGFSCGSPSFQEEPESKQHQEAVYKSKNNHFVW